MKKILTIILDGFGMKEDSYGNAIKNAGMNNFINIWNNYPHCLLKTNVKELKLPKGQCIDSEFGHKLIASGRIIKNKLVDLNEKIINKDIEKNMKFLEMINSLKNSPESNLHIIFLLSDGGISSHINHLNELLNKLNEFEIKNNVCLDLIGDGVDSERRAILQYIKQIENKLNNRVFISSLCGRYFALDENKNFKRVKMYYNLLQFGDGVDAQNIDRILEACYSKNLTDEYIPPLKTSNYRALRENDFIMFMNYSKFNQESILEAFAKEDFIEFPTKKINLNVYSLYEINKKINKNYFFEEEKIENCLSEYMQELGVTEARISESIKRPSITYGLNGSKMKSYINSDTYIVDSPNVERFDQKPEMNALIVAKTAIKCMDKDYDFIIANFANPDVVGKTGNYQATINGLQAIDVCLGKLIEVAEENFYKVIILGSHGKADTIIDRKNNVVTKNTESPVPFIILDKKIKLKNGSLINVAPTILKYMDISVPREMKNTENLFDLD